MNPEYPVFIVSKGRWNSRYTSKALDKLGVPYRVVVEESEYFEYCKTVGMERVIILPRKYIDDYDTCDDLGDTKSKGPGAARNFCWDLATAEGFKRHWVMDDNLHDFHRLNRNIKCPVRTGATLKATEDFVNRYTNVPVAGLNYYSFCKTTSHVPPYVLNTRIYSCLLIDNSAQYRWRGRYNEDTDLCLRVLKDGLCTIQMNAFLCGKMTTQRLAGGNSKEFYDEEGTLPKSQMIADLHPDVAKVVWRFHRHHHHVDYRPFKSNALIRDPDVDVSNGIDNYGMMLIELPDKTDQRY